MRLPLKIFILYSLMHSAFITPVLWYQNLIANVNTKSTSLKILISEPPSAPVISGLPENQALREGQTVHLTCSSMDGSPKPKLTWFKVNQDGSDEKELISKEMVNAKNKILIGSDSSNEGSRTIQNRSSNVQKEHSIATIEIIASRQDNTRLYR